MASWIFVVAAYAADTTLRAESGGKAHLLPTPKSHEVKIGDGTKAMETLLMKFTKANPHVFAETKAKNIDDVASRPEVRDADRGLDSSVLKDTSSMDALFDGESVNQFLSMDSPLPYATAADVQYENHTADKQYDPTIDWNGMYNNDFPSPSQQERKGSSPSGRLEGIAQQLAKNLIGLADEDFTPYYVSMAPKTKMDHNTRQYLKKKEVMKLFKWTTAQLDVMRSRLVDHFVAVDPMMHQLAEYIDSVNSAQTQMNEQLTNMIDDSSVTLGHAKTLVAQRVNNSHDALPNQTDRVWVERLKDDVKNFNKTALAQIGHVELELRKPINAIGGNLGHFGIVYHNYQNAIQEEVTKWARNYQGQVSGVFTRLQQQLDLTHGDLNSFEHSFRMKEMNSQVEWFKNFMHSFGAIQQRSSFLNAATRLMTKTIQKMRTDLTTQTDVFDDRLESWKKNQKRLVSAFDTAVTGFATKAGRKAAAQVNVAANEASGSSTRALKLLLAKSKVQLAQTASKAAEEVDATTLFTETMASKRAVQKDVHAAQRAMSHLPNMDLMKRGINEWPDAVTHFQKHLKDDVFQPSLNVMSMALLTSRQGWTAKQASDEQEQLSSINAMLENVNEDIRGVGNMVGEAYHSAQINAATLKLASVDTSFKTTQFTVPHLDDMWDALRGAESGLEELQDKGEQLTNEVTSLAEVPQHLSEMKSGGLVKSAGKEILKEWRDMSKANMALLQQKLSDFAIPHMKPHDQMSLTEVLPSSNISPMYNKLDNAANLLGQAPESLRSTVDSLGHMLEENTLVGVQKACENFLKYVKHATSLGHLPAELKDANQWVLEARMHLPSSDSQPALVETQAALQRLKKAYYPSVDAEKAVDDSVEDGISKLKRGLVLADRTIATRGLDDSKSLNLLATHVHAWADELPVAAPLEGLLAPRDVRIPSPEVKFPSLAELGLVSNEAPTLESDVRAAQDAASVGRARAISDLLNAAQSAHVLGAEAATPDAGQVLLEDAVANGKASLPVPARRTSVLTAIDQIGDEVSGATNVVKGLMPTESLQKSVPRVSPVQFADISDGEQAVSELRATAGRESLSAAASKQEQDLDRIAENLRPIPQSQVAQEIRDESSQPPIREPAIDELGKESARVATELAKRIEQMHGDANAGFAKTEKQNSDTNGHLEDALSKEGTRVQGSVQAMFDRANALTSAYGTIDEQDQSEDKMDEDIRKELESELDKIPTIKQ